MDFTMQQLLELMELLRQYAETDREWADYLKNTQPQTEYTIEERGKLLERGMKNVFFRQTIMKNLKSLAGKE